MNIEYKIEYSENDERVCIVPWPSVPCEHFLKLIRMYNEKGYRYWLPANHKRGYILSKKFGDNSICQESVINAEKII